LLGNDITILVTKAAKTERVRGESGCRTGDQSPTGQKRKGGGSAPASGSRGNRGLTSGSPIWLARKGLKKKKESTRFGRKRKKSRKGGMGDAKESPLKNSSSRLRGVLKGSPGLRVPQRVGKKKNKHTNFSRWENERERFHRPRIKRARGGKRKSKISIAPAQRKGNKKK